MRSNRNQKASWRDGSAALNKQLNYPSKKISPLILQRIFEDPELMKQFEELLLQGDNIAPFIAQVEDSLKTLAPSAPHSKELLETAVHAFWDWMQSGFDIASPERQEYRLSQCKKCPYYDRKPGAAIYKAAFALSKKSPICGKCGCVLDKKIRMASSNCPAANPLKPQYSLWNEVL